MPPLRIFFDKTIANDTSVDKLAEYYDKFMPSKVSGTTLDEALEKLGAVDPDSPKTVNLYAATFEDKELSLTTLRNTTGMQTRIRLLSIPIMLRCLCPELQQ